MTITVETTAHFLPSFTTRSDCETLEKNDLAQGTMTIYVCCTYEVTILTWLLQNDLAQGTMNIYILYLRGYHFNIYYQ